MHQFLTDAAQSAAGGIEAAEAGSAAPESGSDLPGEPVEVPYEAGEWLSLVAIPEGEALEVREKPGADAPIVDELSSTDSPRATDEARLVDDQIWLKVETNGEAIGDGEGWVLLTSVGMIADHEDVVDELVVTTGTEAEVVDAITAEVSREGPPEAEATVVTAEGDDEGNVTSTVHVLQGGDTSIRGYAVTYDATVQDLERTIDSISVNPICARGLSADQQLCN